MSEKKQLGKILLRQKALSAEQLERALSKPSAGRLASRLAGEGTITDVSALKALSEQHGIPGIDLAQVCLRLEDLDLLPREIAEKHLILPVMVRPERLFVAMANPREKKVIDELEFVTGKRVYAYVALETALGKVIDEAYNRKARGETYYAGPNCPPEQLEKLGITQAGELSEVPLEFENGRAEAPLSAPGVVVDDQVGEISQTDDVSEDGFGELANELSVVTGLSEEQKQTLVGEGKTVLVVDDESDIRKMLARLLSKNGLSVVEADRGLMALHLVKEHAPDLIVLDAMLPEVHGFEIARRIKGSKRYGHIPIIMVSAVYRGWRYAEDLKQTCGVDQYIEKPFKIADLLHAVQRCLRGSPESLSGNRDREISEEAEKALNAGVSAYQSGDLDKAVQHLQRGVSLDPLAYRLHLHLGLLYGKKGQVYEAISELEIAVDINSRHFPAVKNLAILYQKAGFRHKATEMWQRALTLAPDDPTRQSIKQHLMKLL